MEKSVKERLYEAFKNKNYFQYGKKDSLEVLRESEHLEDVIIQVERGCNVDQLLFRYNPETRKFHRVTLTYEDKKLLERDSTVNHNRKCLERQCHKKDINVDSFIELLEFAFEPIAVFKASETNI